MATPVTDKTSSASPRRAAPCQPPGLEVARGPGAPGFHPLDPHITLVGRARYCHVRAAAAGVSHVHCLIIRNAAHYLVRDLGSRSGTFLSGDRVSEAVLQHGDELTVGPISLRVCLPELPPADVEPNAQTPHHADPEARSPDAASSTSLTGSGDSPGSSQRLRDELADLARREERFHSQLAEFEADSRKQRLLLADSAAALRKQWKVLAARQAEIEDQAARLAADEARLHEPAQSLAAASHQADPQARDEEELKARCDELQQLCAALESRKAELETAVAEQLACLQSAKHRSDQRLLQHDDALQHTIDDLLDVGAAIAGPLVGPGH